jgi:hypothetical protein
VGIFNASVEEVKKIMDGTRLYRQESPSMKHILAAAFPEIAC